jgi:hypothetical protein
MTIREIEKFFLDAGIQADVREESDGNVRVITEETVSDDVKFALELITPPGVRFLFSVQSKNRMPIPSVLKNWYKQTDKYLK